MGFRSENESIPGTVKGSTALHAAAARDDNGWTPLLIPARDGRKEMVEFLLSKGADSGAKKSAGQTALSLAEENGRTEIAEILKKHPARK